MFTTESSKCCIQRGKRHPKPKPRIPCQQHQRHGAHERCGSSKPLTRRATNQIFSANTSYSRPHSVGTANYFASHSLSARIQTDSMLERRPLDANRLAGSTILSACNRSAACYWHRQRHDQNLPPVEQRFEASVPACLGKRGNCCDWHISLVR